MTKVEGETHGLHCSGMTVYIFFLTHLKKVFEKRGQLFSSYPFHFIIHNIPHFSWHEITLQFILTISYPVLKDLWHTFPSSTTGSLLWQTLIRGCATHSPPGCVTQTMATFVNYVYCKDGTVIQEVRYTTYCGFYICGPILAVALCQKHRTPWFTATL
jgi:hypothetical protein